APAPPPTAPPASPRPTEESPAKPAEPAPPAPAAANPWHVAFGALFAVWAAGGLFLLLRLLHGCWALGALSRSARPLDAGRSADVLDGVRAALGTEALPPIETSAAVAGPAAGGFFRPRVLLPEGLAETLPGPQLRDVLTHECAHLLRRDPLVGLLQRLAAAL